MAGGWTGGWMNDWTDGRKVKWKGGFMLHAWANRRRGRWWVHGERKMGLWNFDVVHLKGWSLKRIVARSRIDKQGVASETMNLMTGIDSSLEIIENKLSMQNLETFLLEMHYIFIAIRSNYQYDEQCTGHHEIADMCCGIGGQPYSGKMAT